MSDTTPVPQEQPARIPESAARALRTGVQLIPSAVITEFVDAFFYDLNERQYAALGALLLMIFSWLQVMIENKTGYALFRKFSRNNPPIVQTPITPLSDPTKNELPKPVKEAQRLL